MRKVIVTEEQFNNNKRHLIREYLEVLKGDNANSALKVINNLYQKIALQIEQGKPHIEETASFVYKYEYTHIKILVSNSHFIENTQPRYYGYYKTGDMIGPNRIVITFNIKAAENYDTFKETMLHELTHHLDDNRNRLEPEKRVNNARAFLKNTFDKDERLLDNILYKLWTPTERNAYTTKAITNNKDIQELNNYIQDLKDAIEKIRTINWDKKPYDIWVLIKKMMKLPNETTSYKTMDIFCKKSTYLLNKFHKKAMQRMRQHAMDPENEYDTSAKLTMELLQAKQQIKTLAREYRDQDVDLRQFIQILKDEKLITNYNREELTQLAIQQFNQQQEDKTRTLAFDHTGEDPETFAQIAIEQGVKLDKETIIDIFTNFPNRR